MSLFDHMRIHERGIDRSLDTPSTSSTTTMPSPANTPPPSVPTTTGSTTIIIEADANTTDFSYPRCSRTFTSRIGLIGHLRIYLTETSELLPGAPTYTRHIRLHCPHRTRKFIHSMSLLGHMRVHESLQ
ncbi:hypothetical protein SprV_0301314100 [Sparganum proliferum]